MPIYSHSRLSSFEKCPLQYRYRYVDRIKRDTQSVEAFMGNRVHEALESLYRDAGRSRVPPVEEILDLYRRRWDAEWSDRITIVKTDLGADHYRRTGERCLRDYYRRHHPFGQAETVGLEEKVEADLDDRYRIMGYIDRLARPEPGVYEIHDYKTSSSLPRDGDLRKDRQLTFYQMAVRQRFKDARTIRLVWHYLAFDRELISSRSEREEDGHRQEAVRLIRTIEAATDYPARVGALCRWCEYSDICPAIRAADPEPPRRPARPLDQAEQIALFGEAPAVAGGPRTPA